MVNRLDKHKRILFVSCSCMRVKRMTLLFSKLFFFKVWIFCPESTRDLGFLGIKKNITFSNVSIPHKASKHHPLTEEQKSENSTLAAIRVVEHAIAQNEKRFFIFTN